MRHKNKITVRNYFIVGFLLLCLIVGTYIVIAYLLNEMQERYETQIHTQESFLQSSTKQVYVALCEIHAGEQVKEDMVEVQSVLCEQDIGLLFSKDDIGKVAIVNIVPGTYLLNCLVNQAEAVDGLREMCYQSIHLSDNTQNYDVVDIRIRYPNGEDYIVLTGKTIRLKDDMNGTCYLRLNEEEILMMSAAIYDTSLYRGAELYTSRYIEPEIQSRSVVTYTPAIRLIELIQTSPNTETSLKDETVKRKELEKRLITDEEEFGYE